MEHSDENITQFLAFTGSSDTDTARSYLEMSGGSVETAVGLWLEHNGGGGGGVGGGDFGFMGSGSGGAAAAAAAPAGGGSFHGADAVRAPDRTRTEALIGPAGGHGAMAAAMAAGGMFAPGAMSGAEAAMMSAFAAASDDDDDDHMEYVGGGEGSGSGSRSGSVSAAAFDAREAVNEAAAAAAAGSSGGGGGNYGNANDGGDSTSTSNGGGTAGAAAAAAAGGRATSLADMFAPPTNLIYAGPGGFQGARQAARDSRRWLLVNIQSDSDFACHALNRDVWRDELVENLVRDGFIFWQAVDTTSEGSTYSERYRVSGYPHVAIIDPRTARLMWKKEGWTQVNPMTPVQFAETAADFCSRHSFDKPPSAPRSGSAAAGPASGGRPSNKRPMADMSEEEQLEAAIRASMADTDGGGGECGSGSNGNEDEDSVIYADDDEEKEEDDDDDGDANVKAAAAADLAIDDDEVLSDTFEQKLLDQDIGVEPASGDDIARVQIRMPDGKRLVRKFRGEDSVRVIYAFVAQQSSDAVREGKQLELKAGFPPRDLLDRIDESISSCGLAGEAITARCK